MKISKILIFLLIILGLSICSNNKNLLINCESNNNIPAINKSVALFEAAMKSDTVIITPSLNESVLHTEKKITIWQDAYAELLRKYERYNSTMYFVLYDFDRSGTPELIIMGECANDIYESVYSFKDGDIVSLTYGEGVSIAGYALSARSGISANLDNDIGLITYIIGPSAGIFGTSVWYTLVVIEDGMLVVDSHGNRYVDVDALNELFPDFGRNINDLVALDTAIQQHTFWYLNDKSVTQDEFCHTFEAVEQLLPSIISESNIREVIYSFPNP